MRKCKRSARERREKAIHDSKERRKIFEELLEHIESGFSLDSFGMMSAETIREWCVRYPNEFIQEEIDDALRCGKDSWEKIGYKQAVGACLGNSRTWYYNMSNRYGWTERSKVDADVKQAVAVQVVSYARRGDGEARSVDESGKST